ncbi:MAG: Peptide chain release factor 1 [Lentisphaerae bacterium ADurb.Bin242]|nr:MAG: Peptide chain release factor 1 [Lentisphaerae bacterium ADurb.Bin242]
MRPEDLALQLERMKERYGEIETRLSDPRIYADPFQCRTLTRERGRLSEFFRLFKEWSDALRESADNREMLQTEQDEGLRRMIENELAVLALRVENAEKAVTRMLLPPDPNDGRSIIVELRPAAGGEEAALFTAQMLRVYTRYAERRGWKFELLDLSESGLGGVKEAVFSLSGDDVFSRMKFESGVHRVQRVPVTEASGRIHTSTITVSVLPEAEEMDDIALPPEDLEISTFRSSGPGGQNVNRTDSAVRIVHKPSGITVASQQERSQIRNREIALRILKSKLLEIRQREEARKQADSKRSQVGTGDRSERIRTYNFPQNRVTDHRYGISAHDMPSLLEGNLDLILDPILEEEGRNALKSALEREMA